VTHPSHIDHPQQFKMASREDAVLPSAAIFMVVAAVVSWLSWSKRMDRWKELEMSNEITKHCSTQRASLHKATEYSNSSSCRSSDWPSHLQRELYKEERREIMRPFITMKKPMYDNIVMLAPDGCTTLSTISRKKAQWYLQKGLATWHTITLGETARNSSTMASKSRNDSVDGDDPLAIRLLFEPKVSAKPDAALQRYNTSFKSNCCVVCGAHRDYMRHYVVPYCYRMHIPPHYKTHLPHDVVLLCLTCHTHAERAAHRRMHQVEQELRQSQRDSLHPTSAQAELVDKHVYQVQSAASALLNWPDRLPPATILAYQERVQDWYLESTGSISAPSASDHKEANAALSRTMTLDPAVLNKACQLQSRRPNPHFVPGADLVIASLQSQASEPNEFDPAALATFIRDWRRHFIEHLHPRFLPRGWSVQAAVRCDSHSSLP
jgi:exonuclease 3'-5' domain-containing protein 2